MKEISRKRIKELQATPLFAGVGEEVLNALLKDERTVYKSYRRNETVYNPAEFEKALAYIVAGTAAVKMSNSDFPMRSLDEGSFFGVAALFNEDGSYVSEIVCARPLQLILFKEESIRELLDKNSVFRENYLRFLSDRIRYLNRKIGYLANSSRTNSLVEFICSRDSEEFELPLSYSQLARHLNMSRSSLYRGLDELEEKQLIKRQGRKITILDPTALRIMK